MTSVAKTAKRPATYEDLMQVPDHLVAEIVEGELFASPRPAGPHERAMGAIYARLRFFFDDGDGPGGWWISVEPELHLGNDVLVPDVCGWRRARVGGHPVAGAAATIAPDWICEVLSPRTGILDRKRKLPSYARHGVQYAWIVDTAQQTVEVLRVIEEGRWSVIGVHGGDELARMEPFEAIEFPLARLWFPSIPPA
jgi:Uma2 family endonuclease